MLEGIDRDTMLEIFAYLKDVHIRRRGLIEQITDVYGETLYVDSMVDLKNAIINYLNSLTELNTRNTELMSVYDAIINRLKIL